MDSEERRVIEGIQEQVILPLDDEPQHVYDWLDEPSETLGEVYAKEWLNEFCKESGSKNEDWLNRFKVWATWRGQRWHVSGASSMGDVWLRKKGSAAFYDHRVRVEDLSNWSRQTLAPGITRRKLKPQLKPLPKKRVW